MITVWRVIKHAYRHAALTGEGARLYGGRWNSVGRPVIYTAGTLSLAMLEIMVHLKNQQWIYENFIKINLSIPETIIQALPRCEWPHDWNRLPPSVSTQRLGDVWLNSAEFCVFKVPSTVVQDEYNYLINPNHPDFQLIRIGKFNRLIFDPRLAVLSDSD